MDTLQINSASGRLRVQLKPSPIYYDIEVLRQSDQTGPFGNVAERSHEVRIESHRKTHLIIPCSLFAG